jgi:hypothetical protein
VAAEPTSKNELDELRSMVARNLRDAAVVGVSPQGRFEFAYNAARLLATIVIRVCGYRVVTKTGHHYFTFQALEAADTSFAKAAANFDTARRKRNDFSYDAPAEITKTDADDLINAVTEFLRDVERWIAATDSRLK